MSTAELHHMTTELLADRQVIRFSCPICDRCVESSPDGIRVVNRGDQSVRHQGGNMNIQADVEQDTPTPPVLH